MEIQEGQGREREGDMRGTKKEKKRKKKIIKKTNAAAEKYNENN